VLKEVKTPDAVVLHTPRSAGLDRNVDGDLSFLQFCIPWILQFRAQLESTFEGAYDGRPVMSAASDPPVGTRTAAETTTRLLSRAQAGDADALNDLFRRHVPWLSRWARGRLPAWARDAADTHDLVQETALQTFKNVRAFESRGKGALRAYLRQALLNRVRNELRRVSRRPAIEELDENAPSPQSSPLQTAIERQQHARYEAALARLSGTERELIVARLELGLTYEEMAKALGKPSWNAARMAVARALIRLAGELKRG